MSTKTRRLDSVDPVVMEQIFTKQVVAMAISGLPANEIAKKLSISKAAVLKIQATENYKDIVTHAGEKDLAPVIAKAKHKLAYLAEKAVRVVEKAMDSALDGTGSMREGIAAAQLSLKAVGLHEEQDKQSDTQITVVLPGGVETRTIEVPNEEV